MDVARFLSNLEALHGRLDQVSDGEVTVGRFLAAWRYRNERGDW